MIIVHPDDIVGAENRLESVCEQLIDLLVLVPKRLLVNRVRGEIMKQRPDRRIAKSQVKLFHLLFGKKYRVGLKSGQGYAHDLRLKRALDAATRPTDPEMLGWKRGSWLAGFAKGREPGHQAAGAWMKCRPAIDDFDVEGQAVGYNNQSSPAQLRPGRAPGHRKLPHR